MYSARVALVLLGCVAVRGFAQEVRSIEGQVRSDTVIDFTWLTVRIDIRGATDPAISVPVHFDGSFELRGIAMGDYVVHVLNRNGDELTAQPLTVGPMNVELTLRLPSQGSARPTGETTSLARLRHRPVRKALNAARDAQKLSMAGDHQRAIEALQKAVAADPEYSEAYGNLGAELTRVGHFPDAVTEFERAIAIDPATAVHQANLAVALTKLGRLEEAEQWARGAVRLDSASPLAHYILGCVLANRGQNTAEALQQLQQASRDLPMAHRTLAEMYQSLGKREQAEEEMRQLNMTEPLQLP